MALTDQTRQSEASQLSVDAAAFVPEVCRNPHTATKERHEHATPEASVSAGRKLPHFVTSCYPFVTGDPGFQPRPSNNPRAHAAGQNSVRPVQHGGSQVTSTSSTRPVAYGFQQPGYVPFVQQLPSPPVIPLPSFCSNNPNPSSVVPGVIAYPNQLMNPVNQLPAFTQVPPPTLQWVDTGRQGFMPQNASVRILPGVNVPNVDYAGSVILPSAKLNWPVSDKKSKVVASSKKHPRAKVIVCRDNCVQTDFNEELARATLLERPNSFFLGSTAPEDVDSDSGYSSPQHRQTTAAPSDSAAVAAAAVPVGPTPVGVAPSPQRASRVLEASHSVQQPALVTYMPDGRHIPMIYAPYPFQGRPTRNMFMPAAKRSQVSPGPQSASHRGGYSKGRNRGSANRKAAKQQSVEPKPLMNNQTASVNDGVRSTVTATSCSEPALPFDDVDEFPYLLSAAGGLIASQVASSTQHLNPPTTCRLVEHWGAPSNAARQQRVMSHSNEVRRMPGGNFTPTAVRNIPGLVLSEKETKALRKKVKRQEIANRAAEKELAEISLEQQVLRELRAKQTQKQGPGDPQAVSQASVATSVTDFAITASLTTATCAKSQPAVATNWASMTEKPQMEEAVGSSNSLLPLPREVQSADTVTQSAAVLEAAAQAKKVRDRELMKSKKPSSLKKVILKEREEKKRHQLIDDTLPLQLACDDQGATGGRSSLMPEQCVESAVHNGSPQSGEVSPVSQMSPYNMSPLSVSPVGSAGVSPIAGISVLGPGAPGMTSVLAKIHSRRFREYCNQVLDKEIDDCCTELLQDLVRFQEQTFNKDPSKTNRRIVMGLREVTKHLKLNQLQCIIISPNMERIQSKGGLDDALNNIIEMSRQQDVPFVFALGRRALGRVCAKLVPVSIVGIFCYEGTEENFHRLCQLTEKARKAYADMVSSLEQEMVAALASASNMAGEKDTSSAAASALARGPLTGNLGGFEKMFPHLGHSRTPSACSAISIISSVLSEPISENYPASEPDAEPISKDTAGQKLTNLDTVGESREEMADAPLETDKLGTVGDIDAGHEADTEDDSASDGGRTRRTRSASHADSGNDKPKSECTERPRSAASKQPADCRELGQTDPTDHPTAKPASRPPAIDSKRIASWVEESQRAIESMRVSASSDGGLLPDDEEEEVQDADVEEEAEADVDAGVNGSGNDGDGDDDDDDSLSMKTVDEERSSLSSTSHYVEAVDDTALPPGSAGNDP